MRGISIDNTVEAEVSDIYLSYIKEDLNKLKKHIADIKFWNDELEMLEEKINAFSDRDIDVSGFKSGAGSYSLDNVIIGDEAQKNILEGKIISAEYKLKRMRVYFNQLDEESKMLMELRYMTNNKKNLSFDKIKEKLHYSKNKLVNMHDEAIRAIAYYKYECTGDAYNK